MRRIITILCSFLLFANTYANTEGLKMDDLNAEKKPLFGFTQDNRIVDFVHKTIETSQYSSYKLGGTSFDTSRGRYVLDCSSYLDNILQRTCPQAYSSLVNSSGTDNPTTKQYFEFIDNLSDEGLDHWSRVDEIQQLQPGDILVFREVKAVTVKKTKKTKKSKKHKKAVHTVNVTRGHVMVVMSKPIRDDNTYEVQVADSAPVGHSEDTREPHTSGIGMGTLLLKENPSTGEPTEYAWKVGSRWKRHVNIAMARPVG